MGRYESYCDHLQNLYHKLAWDVEKDVLRIPSTRNVALIGRRRTFSMDNIKEEADEDEEWLVQTEAMEEIIPSIAVTVRKSDRELGLLLERKRAKGGAAPGSAKYRFP